MKVTLGLLRAAIAKVPQLAILNSTETNERIENFSSEMGVKRRSQMKIKELKYSQPSFFADSVYVNIYIYISVYICVSVYI